VEPPPPLTMGCQNGGVHFEGLGRPWKALDR
jgi:hypothetical protein